MPTEDEQIREALNLHWRASAVGDANAEHDIYDDNTICDYPQSGERILGRNNLQALRSHHPGKPSGFNVRRIVGKGDLWIPNTQSPTRSGRHSPSASWNSATARWCTRHNISRIPSRRPPGGANGCTRSRDAGL